MSEYVREWECLLFTHVEAQPYEACWPFRLGMDHLLRRQALRAVIRFPFSPAPEAVSPPPDLAELLQPPAKAVDGGDRQRRHNVVGAGHRGDHPGCLPGQLIRHAGRRRVGVAFDVHMRQPGLEV
eukprot:scaffold90399_cov28-Prasinocladus_malaysianus.AAC.1